MEAAHPKKRATYSCSPGQEKVEMVANSLCSRKVYKSCAVEAQCIIKERHQPSHKLFKLQATTTDRSKARHTVQTVQVVNYFECTVLLFISFLFTGSGLLGGQPERSVVYSTK